MNTLSLIIDLLIFVWLLLEVLFLIRNFKFKRTTELVETHSGSKIDENTMKNSLKTERTTDFEFIYDSENAKDTKLQKVLRYASLVVIVLFIVRWFI